MEWIQIFHLIQLAIIWGTIGLSAFIKHEVKKPDMRGGVILVINLIVTVLLMIPVGIEEFGYSSNEMFAIWLVMSLILTVIFLFCTAEKDSNRLAGKLWQILPSSLFLMDGIALEYPVLIGMSVVLLLVSAIFRLPSKEKYATIPQN